MATITKESNDGAISAYGTARSTVKVAGLVNPGWLIEIEVTAVRK